MRRRVLRAGRSCCYSRTILAHSIFSLQGAVLYQRAVLLAVRQTPHTLQPAGSAPRDCTQLSGAHVLRRAEDEREKEAALAALPQGYYDPEFDAVAAELGVLRPAFTEEELEAVVEARAAALEVVSERLSAHVLARYDSFIEGVAEVGAACRPPGAARAREEAVSGRVLVGACAHQLWLPRSAHGRRARLPRSGSGGSRQEPRRPDALFAARGSARRPTRAALSSSWPDRMGLG